MKLNKKFYLAVDWVKEHGYDFYNQFDEDTWAAAEKYVELVYFCDMKKSEAQEYIRTNF